MEASDERGDLFGEHRVDADPDAAETRVHAGGRAVGGGQASQQGAQGVALGAVQPGTDRLVVRPCRLPDPPHQLGPGGGQVQRVLAAVGRVGATFEQSTRVEVVDQGHQPGRRGTQQVRQFPLGPARLRADCPQRTDLRRRQIQRRHPFGELLRGVRAELGEEERRCCYRRFPSSGSPSPVA